MASGGLETISCQAAGLRLQPAGEGDDLLEELPDGSKGHFALRAGLPIGTAGQLNQHLRTWQAEGQSANVVAGVRRKCTAASRWYRGRKPVPPSRNDEPKRDWRRDDLHRSRGTKRSFASDRRTRRYCAGRAKGRQRSSARTFAPSQRSASCWHSERLTDLLNQATDLSARYTDEQRRAPFSWKSR